jgi:two-component system phosphate regulon response regulator PhoB
MQKVMSDLILVVDDEHDLVSTLDYNLKKEGFETRTANNGAEALQALDARPTPDLVLLDLMLPDIPGSEICRRIRANPDYQNVPVVMLTAKGEEIDRVVGFEIGADDYVSKPFSVRELMLRIRAILKRSRKAATADKQETHLRFGDLRLDRSSHRLWVAEEEIYLTALEFKLLATFLERRGRVQTRETLLSDVWGVSGEVTTRTVDTHVRRLREKLGKAGSYIETLRGVGYRFRESPNQE